MEDVHPETLEEQPPEFLSNLFNEVRYILSRYGWYILGFSIVFLYVWRARLKPLLEQWQTQREDREYSARYHKDPDMAKARLDAMAVARRKLQEEHDAKTAAFATRQKEREEMKRQEKLAERERLEGRGKGRVLGTGSSLEDNASNPSQSSLRPEYNPLMGSGSSSGYRPARRSCCPGGGCG